MGNKNVGKGILFALIGMAVGFGIWLAVIAFFGVGTGGAVGGAFAAVLGMLVAGGYKKGSEAVGAIGYIIVILITLAGAIGALLFGTTIYVYNEGVGSSLGNALEMMLDNRTMRFALIQDGLISGAISVAMAIMTLVGNKKDKKAD